MIRPVTLFCAGVAAFSGLYMYHVKHQTQLLERNITRTTQAIDATRERTGVLRAEWTLMNDPERLAELAGQFLNLVTVSPRQFTTAADLGSRLPPPRAVPAQPDFSTDEPPADAPAPGTDTAEPIAEAPLPLPPPAPPGASPRPVAPAIAAAPAPRPATAVAAAAPAPAPVPTHTAPRASQAVAAQQPPPRPHPVPTLAPIPAALPPAVGVASGSALGMARGIVAPPVPVSGDIHLTRGN